MAIACGSAVVAALPLLTLLPVSPLTPTYAAPQNLAVALLFLMAGLRLGFAMANGHMVSARSLVSLVFPLVGALTLPLPPLPAFSILVLAHLGLAHEYGRAVDAGNLPRAFGTSGAIAAIFAVSILLAALVGAAI